MAVYKLKWRDFSLLEERSNRYNESRLSDSRGVLLASYTSDTYCKRPSDCIAKLFV